MKNFKLWGLIIGGLASAFWIYFNISSALSQDGWQIRIYHLVLGMIYLIPPIIAWRRPIIGGWLYTGLALFFGGAYFYLIFFVSSNSYPIWVWLVMLAFLVALPVIGGTLLIKSVSNKK